MRTPLLVVSALVLIAAAAGAQPPVQRPEPPPGTGLVLGRTIDAGTGRPVPGAIVTINGSSVGASLRLMTDKEGRFVVRELRKGTLTLTAAKPGYLDGAFGRRRPGGLTQSIDLEDGARIADVTIPLWRHGAIAGTVVDEAGEPVVGVSVRAFRRTVVGGRRGFAGSGTAFTDDRGMYRLANLTPGDYIVAVVSTTIAIPMDLAEDMRQASLSNSPNWTTAYRDVMSIGVFGTVTSNPNSVQIGSQLLQTPGRGSGAIPPPPDENGRLFVYPTTFYPGGTSAATAQAVAVSSGEERSSVDFQMKPVATVRVSGNVTGADGPIANIVLHLVAEGSEQLPDFDTAATAADKNGAFTFAAVPPGQYTIRVVQLPRVPPPPNTTATVVQMGGGAMFSTVTLNSGPNDPLPPVPTEPALWATVPVAAGTRDLNGIAVAVREGPRVSGRLEFEGTTQRPQPNQLAVIPVALERADGAGGPGPGGRPGRADASGQFTTPSVPGGKYFVRVGGAPGGWTFKSITYQGRDLADTPIDLDSDLAGVVITFTDKPVQLTGTVRRGDGAADPDATVIVFPADSNAWANVGMNSRRLRAARSTPTGTYRLAGLPAGDYNVIAIPDEFASEWQDPKVLEGLAAQAQTVHLEDGERKTLDVRTTTPR